MFFSLEKKLSLWREGTMIYCQVEQVITYVIDYDLSTIDRHEVMLPTVKAAFESFKRTQE